MRQNKNVNQNKASCSDKNNFQNTGFWKIHVQPWTINTYDIFVWLFIKRENVQMYYLFIITLHT